MSDFHPLPDVGGRKSHRKMVAEDTILDSL